MICSVTSTVQESNIQALIHTHLFVSQHFSQVRPLNKVPF